MYRTQKKKSDQQQLQDVTRIYKRAWYIIGIQ